MKNLFNQIFTSILTIGFVVGLNLFSTQDVVAQPPFLPKLKDTNEVRELAKFAESLAEFYTAGDAIAKINTGPGTADPGTDLINKLHSAGNKLWNEERSVGAYSEKLTKQIAKILAYQSKPTSSEAEAKKMLDDYNKADEDFNKEVEKLLKMRNARPFFKDTSLLLVSTFQQTDNKRIEKDTLSIVQKPLKLGFYKPKFPCAVLATAIFAAELRGSSKTAATVDLFFKAVCNASGSLDQ